MVIDKKYKSYSNSRVASFWFEYVSIKVTPISAFLI